jgi:transcriptional regulator GlxA family with amidase domain
VLQETKARLIETETEDFVAALRMRRASTLLRSTPEKVETIAQQVGYGSVCAFSTALKRWSGQGPALFRRNRG